MLGVNKTLRKFYILQIGNKYLGHVYDEKNQIYKPILKKDIEDASRYSSEYEVEEEVRDLTNEDKKYLKFKKKILTFEIKLIEEKECL